MEKAELNFIFIRFDEEKAKSSNAEGRMVCLEKGGVIEIYEGTIRNCINQQLKMLYVHGITENEFRIRKGDR